MKKNPLINILKWVVLVGLFLFVLIQFIPYGRDHSNPPVVKEPNWDSAETREIAKKACFDCHSNETRWPWYSFVAPASWLLQYDAEQARRNINFSEWEDISSKYLVLAIEDGVMPPFRYIIIHPEANLSDQEKEKFIQGLRATMD